MTYMNTHDLVNESNRIEGIDRPPTEAEIREHERFVGLDKVTISELQSFVRIYQPHARLRSFPGMDVQVGSYVPPKGGEHIVAQLQALLTDINADEKVSPWEAHIQYEKLHPFSDCNGRSGRILHSWQLRRCSRSLGFLHEFYYQTLKKYASGEVMKSDDARDPAPRPDNGNEARWIVEPKSRGFDVVDTVIMPRQAGFYCYCVDRDRAELIARLLNRQDWGVA
jgi:Fic/DOC family protein